MILVLYFSNAQAYICNYVEHWFTIRKFGSQWFNLNSLLSNPEPISDTYLSLFLKQLQTEGYSIFIVYGILPHSDADQVTNFDISNYTSRTSNHDNINYKSNVEDEVIANSLKDYLEDEKRQLELALKMSLENN